MGLYFLFSRHFITPGLEAKEIIGTFVNLTALAVERKRVEREIRNLAYYDPLTGLYNRRHLFYKFNQKINEAFINNQKLALLFLDLDQFKWVNDSLGHDYGDSVLIEVANRLRHVIEKQVLLSRIGGDEFVLLMTNVYSEQDVKSIIHEIMALFKDPIALNHHEIRIKPSIGVSLFPDHGTTAVELLKKADSAMYQSKYEGRNEYKIYESSYDRGKENRLFLTLEMEQALVKHQFTLLYQPIIDLKSGHIQSLEVLIRWNHPKKGSILPNEFIPLAEESGFIVNLGEWIIQEACRQNKAWQDKGLPPIRVAINVSAKQFHHVSFVDRIQAILVETNLAPEWLEIEITESVLMNDELKMISILHELRGMGVRISIDDFGTGYSSLNYLRSFPVNALKVDRSFIKNISDDRDAALITRMIIDLAHNLHMEVIGEGVETESQNQFLLQNGCERAQGYFYYHPLTSLEVERLLIKSSEPIMQA